MRSSIIRESAYPGNLDYPKNFSDFFRLGVDVLFRKRYIRYMDKHNTTTTTPAYRATATVGGVATTVYAKSDRRSGYNSHIVTFEAWRQQGRSRRRIAGGMSSMAVANEYAQRRFEQYVEADRVW